MEHWATEVMPRLVEFGLKGKRMSAIWTGPWALRCHLCTLH